jgi:hypothetical protein
MNNTTNQKFECWSDLLNHKVKILHGQIAALMLWVEKSQGDAALAEQLCKPYYRLLERIYEEDFPIANAIETSDLVLQMEGEALDHRDPRISLIATIFANVRKQVGSVAHAISGVTDKANLPKDVDLGLTAFAPGSLYLGFSLPDPSEPNEKGQKSLLNKNDPLYKATREAIHVLGIVSQRIDEGKSDDEIAKDFPDPKIRDTALSAIQHLAPTGRMGISSVSLAGKNFTGKSFHRLTPEIRTEVRKWIEQPVKTGDYEEFVGTIREVDLDLRRVELRRLVKRELQEIRCIYPESFAGIAEQALNKKARAYGRIEKSPDGKPRLLQIEKIELLDPPTESKGQTGKQQPLI